ncbi:GTP-binding protein ERG [Carex littledalei]|uniref:GTP-binding protein ERG n=1 Tax=Carex littledalei TaxID=544730 RepID=A0A833QPI4_9POAL|nr:GTP-binding protein ERG [Carex littledalei]
MRALRLTSAAATSATIRPFVSLPLRLFSGQTASDSDTPPNPEFDSSDYTLPSTPSPSQSNPRLDSHYRARADEALFGKKMQSPLQEEKERERATRLARSLLEASLESPDNVEEGDDMVVREEDQMSLSVGIIGAPNAGKSCLTNLMVGTKVAAVSRKTNTTAHETLGVITKGNTQICFFDTPGLMIGSHGHPKATDVRFRVESAWNTINLYDILIVIFDVHRHLTIPDKRVIKLIKLLGKEEQPDQKRILCMNKVDLVTDKKDLLKVAREFEDLPGYDRYFMISGLKGAGVKDLEQYLMDQAVKRPWEEEPEVITEEVMKNISMEVVRERMLDHIHQEIPYVIDHKLMGWKEFRNGSIRIEQHFITQKQSQRQILVGKKGSKIGRIGIEANRELRSIFKREVHLILQVRVAKRKSA